METGNDSQGKNHEAAKKKVAFHTLGCRLNFAESGSISQGFIDRGFEIVPFGETADVVFVNTCTVTDQADSTCRNLIRKARKSSPSGTLVVAGCYAQMESQKIAQIPGVDLILGTSEKYKVFDYLDEHWGRKAEAASEEILEQVIRVDKSPDFFAAATSHGDGHTRAFLKIQDGCNYVCSFCIIPFARGRSRAIEPAVALQEAQKLVDRGFKEVVLAGVNIGEYESLQEEGQGLATLVRDLLQIQGLRRLRLSSVEPNTITPELLSVLNASPKSMDHFHVPLQSGADEVLKAMKRKYTVGEYRRIIGHIKSHFPRAGIGADVIVGFPGETDEHFEQTFELLRTLPITHFHIFPYSKRKGTVASRMEGHVEAKVKRQRVQTLIQLGQAKLREFAETFVGQRVEVLFEQEEGEGSGHVEGYSSQFVRVRAPMAAFSHSPQNQIFEVLIEKCEGDALIGRPLFQK